MVRTRRPEVDQDDAVLGGDVVEVRIIEVNTGCNLDCPICFADSGHQPDGYSITLQQCERMLDVFVESEGEAEVVMFSGGEPTIHQQILEFIVCAAPGARIPRSAAVFDHSTCADDARRSIADVIGPDSLQEVRAFKKAAKAAAME